ncbi:MAG: transposase [Terriglobia bacterium]
MTHLRRLVRSPGTYFVTSNTWERRPLFRKESPANLFLDCLFHYRNEGSFLLHEFVLMPDHFHLLLTPAPNVTLERAFNSSKAAARTASGRNWGIASPSGKLALTTIESEVGVTTSNAELISTRTLCTRNWLRRERPTLFPPFTDDTIGL